MLYVKHISINTGKLNEIYTVMQNTKYSQEKNEDKKRKNPDYYQNLF